MVKNPPANEGDVGLIPGSPRLPGEGNGNPPQYFCLGNPIDREEPGRLLSMGLQRVRHNLVEQTYCIMMVIFVKIVHIFVYFMN